MPSRNSRILIPALVLGLIPPAIGNPPAWWSGAEPPVLEPGVEPNNHGPANIGQAKHVAHSALLALRGVVPRIADAVEEDLVGEGKPIPHWNAPANQEERAQNHAPLLLGQLKAISAPFYIHIKTHAPGMAVLRDGTCQPPCR